MHLLCYNEYCIYIICYNILLLKLKSYFLMPIFYAKIISLHLLGCICQWLNRIALDISFYVYLGAQALSSYPMPNTYSSLDPTWKYKVVISFCQEQLSFQTLALLAYPIGLSGWTFSNSCFVHFLIMRLNLSDLTLTSL